MSRPIILVVLAIGFFFFIIGIFFSKGVAALSAVVILVILLIALGPDGVLRKDQIVDNWATLIGGAQGKAQEIFQNTETFIKNSQVPSLKIEKKTMAPGMVRGLLGVERNFLVVTNEANSKLKPYKIFLNVRDYGNNLDVSWYLTYQPLLWQAIVSLIPYVSVTYQTLSDLDLFDWQDLRAYVTVAHRSLLGAVEKLMLSLNQDPAKMERKSKGFLGIS